jgi:hypothetical protein
MADSMNTDTERMNTNLQTSEIDDNTPLFGDGSTSPNIETHRS